MGAAANLVEVAALVGDTARATMLDALMGGQALTSSELASIACVSRPTASEHLTRMVAARLLTVTRKRRNRYYRIASPLVANMLESIKAVAAIETPARYQSRSTPQEPLRFARTCYDHLAGQLGVAIADALSARRYVVLTEEGGEVTPSGRRFLTEFGLESKSKAGGRFAVPVSTGASGVITSPVSSARRSGAAPGAWLGKAAERGSRHQRDHGRSTRAARRARRETGFWWAAAAAITRCAGRLRRY